MASINRPRMSEVRIRLRLSGAEGNIFVILSRCQEAMMEAGASQGQHEQFLLEALSGDYDHLIRTVRDWFAVSD